MTKKCKICEDTKNINEFPTLYCKKRNKTYYRNLCKPCYIQRRREQRNKNNKILENQNIKQIKCIKCNKIKSMLEFSIYNKKIRKICNVCIGEIKFKECKTCGKLLLFKMFRTRKQKGNKVYFNNNCKKCENIKHSKSRYKKKRINIYDQLKKEGIEINDKC